MSYSHDFHTHQRLRLARLSAIWDAGSFFIFQNSERFLQVFDDLQLKPDSQELALRSLLRYVDAHRPLQSFIALKARDMKNIARSWLESGEGRHFWGEDESHILHGEMTEVCGVLEYPEDKKEIIYNLKELLKMMKSRAEHFYWVSLQKALTKLSTTQRSK